MSADNVWEQKHAATSSIKSSDLLGEYEVKFQHTDAFGGGTTIQRDRINAKTEEEAKELWETAWYRNVDLISVTKLT